jgi:hypothetical protein
MRRSPRSVDVVRDPASSRHYTASRAGDEVGEVVVTDTLTTVPEDGSVSWTTRSMAKRHGIGKDTLSVLPGIVFCRPTGFATLG